MEKESNVENLQFAYKPEVPRHVHLCETEAESGPDQIETTEEIQHGVTAETNLTLSCDEELEQICSLAIQDINQQLDDRRKLLREFWVVFAIYDNELGQTHLVQHEIDTGDTLPVKLARHRLAPGKIILVKKEIEDMLAQNIIRRPNSPYSAIVLVTKKDGSNRMCTDFRRLNEVIKSNKERRFSPSANWPDTGSSSRSNDFLKPRSSLWILASPISWECYTKNCVRHSIW